MPRAYNNSRREQQAAKTREDILDAVAKHIAEPSSEEFRVARVAEIAGVSTATVYHHFGTREGLMDAFDGHFHARYRAPLEPKTLDALPAYARELFRWFAENDELVRVRLQTRAGLEQRRHSRATRGEKSLIQRALLAEFGAPAARRVAAVFTVMGSSQAWLTLADELGMGPDEAADLAGWATQAILAAAQRDAKGGAAATPSTKARPRRAPGTKKKRGASS